VIYKAPATAGLQDVLDATGDQATAEDVVDLVFTSQASGATDLRFVWVSGSTSPAGQTFLSVSKRSMGTATSTRATRAR